MLVHCASIFIIFWIFRLPSFVFRPFLKTCIFARRYANSGWSPSPRGRLFPSPLAPSPRLRPLSSTSTPPDAQKTRQRRPLVSFSVFCRFFSVNCSSVFVYLVFMCALETSKTTPRGPHGDQNGPKVSRNEPKIVEKRATLSP